MVDIDTFLLVDITEWNITSLRPLNSWCLWCCKLYYSVFYFDTKTIFDALDGTVSEW